MSANRGWMYTMRATNDTLNPAFQQIVTYFLDFAYKNAKNIKEQTIDGVQVLSIRCPCSKCRNRFYKTREEVERHLITKGFRKNYELWYAHGELHPTQDVGQCSNPLPPQLVGQDADEDLGEYTGHDQMVIDGMHQNHDPYYQQGPQDPNQSAQAFYHMLEKANEPLWEGSKDTSTLSITTSLVNWKSDCNVSDSTFDKLLVIIKELLPDGNKLPGNFYETKKMLKPLELPSQQIHVCKNYCMLFYGQYSDLVCCRVCNESRIKERGNKVPKLVMHYMPIGPRLQRLFYSKKTAQHMTWHAEHHREPNMMSHPSEGRAWNHFDSVFHDFAQETRNVRFGLCTDGFNPNNTNGNSYSCWPVFITVYSLPPWSSLKERYVQLPLLIPGPKSPTKNLDIFLQPLVDELKMLFTHGIETYDAYKMSNFQMKVVLLWTISDFPAYAMLSGWSTHGKLACPYCSKESGSFQLPFGRKPCWFDCHRQHLPANHSFRKDVTNFIKNKKVSCHAKPIPQPTGEDIWHIIKDFPTVYPCNPHRSENDKLHGFGETHNWVKRSIFWDLPYWHKLLIRHNLDVMHIEKNVFDNLFNTMMGTQKSKDNMKARQDIAFLCDRTHLNPIRDSNEKITKVKGAYTLQKSDVTKVCAWLKKLKFPDYASNIGSCVNTKDSSFYAFKSHDSHVFMQRLLPLAIRGFLSKEIYDAITELCMFFRVLCSKRLHVEDLLQMRRTIVTTVCKLEKIFPPGFFDSMEHLMIHLADEALLGGPVQYRWMYQYERKLGLMKRRIRNKSRIEGSIVREHLMSEIATYSSMYFDLSIETRHNKEPRNFAPQHPNSSKRDSELSVFVVPSRRLYEKGGTRRSMSTKELKKVHTYVLLNCAEVNPYVIEFDEEAPRLYPNKPSMFLRDDHFADWFKERVRKGLSDGSTRHLEILATKPSKFSQSHNGYFVNGYKFHTQKYGKGLVTNNYGVCVRGEACNAKESDYYGLLDEILELKYSVNVPQTVVLFKCTWFDIKRGVIVNKNKLVDVKPKFKLPGKDVFILASQAEQVFYTSYPAVTSDTKDLWAVVKTKARHIYEITTSETEVTDGGNMEADGFLQMDERFELPNEVTRGENACLVTNTTIEPMSGGEDEGFEGEQFEEEEFVDEDDTFDDDVMVLSDHFSDEDEQFEEGEFEDEEDTFDDDEMVLSDHFSDEDEDDS